VPTRVLGCVTLLFAYRQIPGLGEKSLPRVERKIKTQMGEDAKPPKETPSAVQLMGLYLAIGREREWMLRWLKDDCGCQERHASATVDALETKACKICDEPTDPVFASPPPKEQRPRLPPTREESEKGIMQGTEEEKAEALQRMQDQSSALQKLLFFILGGGLIAIIVLHLTIGFV